MRKKLTRSAFVILLLSVLGFGLEAMAATPKPCIIFQQNCRQVICCPPTYTGSDCLVSPIPCSDPVGP